jgi:hypothetical protein
MRRLVLSTALWTAALTLVVFAESARADNPPRYLVLQPVNRGQATPVRTYPYAYGWFGAVPNSESTFHRTYSQTGRNWTYQLP